MADTKKYYWLKLKNDFFTDKRIKKLRKIAGGDTYTIIYLKMQLLSLQDEGNLYYEGIEDTFEEEIALQIDEDIEDVRLTISFLLNTGLLVENNDYYELMETKNCIGKESESAERVRQFRNREKQKTLQCNGDVTKCNTEIEKEKEIDIEKENIYNYIEKNFGRTLSPIEYEEISQWKDDELTRYAIKQAVLNGVYAIKYITKTLFNYEKEGIKSVQQAQEQEKKFKNKHKNKTQYEAPKPDWIDKELKSEEMTEEDKSEVNQLLDDIYSTIDSI